VETLLARYRGYLVRERGLSPSTAGLYAHLTSPLLASRMAGGELDLASLTAADVIGFVRASCPGRAVGTAKLVVSALRSLLGFLRGGCDRLVVGTRRPVGGRRDTSRLAAGPGPRRGSAAVGLLRPDHPGGSAGLRDARAAGATGVASG
jgi:Phage integrase, N-terminal SAM-like domain